MTRMANAEAYAENQMINLFDELYFLMKFQDCVSKKLGPLFTSFYSWIHLQTRHNSMQDFRRLKLKNYAVPNILDPTVMLHHTSDK